MTYTTERPAFRDLSRALADQTTADNPGLTRPAPVQAPAFLGAIGARSRPAVQAFGGPADPGREGTSVAFPQVAAATRQAVLVAPQSTEKSEIASSAVSFDSLSDDLVTYAGGGDVSWQLLAKSAPAYRDALLAALTQAWAARTDTAFVTALLADSRIGTGAYAAGGDTDGAAFGGAVGTAVVAIESWGLPADVVLVPSDLYAALVGKPLYANDPRVAGRAIVHAPSLPADRALVASSLAADWYEDGSPHVSSIGAVQKLGDDVAVWSMGAAAVYEPLGLVALTLS